MFSRQRDGRALLRTAYRKENTKDYFIVNQYRIIFDGRCVPHVFLPYQANSTFHGDNKPSEELSYVAYLIRQGQQVVVEEDGGNRHLTILVANRYSEL